MTDHDDTLDLREIAGLAREGRDELAAHDPSGDADLWAGIEARLVPTPVAATDAASAPPRRPATWWPTAAAAAVALVVGVAAGSLVTRNNAASDPTTLATVELDALTADAVPTTAALRDGPEGRTISIDLAALPATDGFHEVWLLNTDTGALVSLGPVRADGTYVVPDTVDLVDLPVLDVSVEPQDGDPTHSGDSVLRGEVTWLG